mgnify:CR=1 FL=1
MSFEPLVFTGFIECKGNKKNQNIFILSLIQASTQRRFHIPSFVTGYELIQTEYRLAQSAQISVRCFYNCAGRHNFLFHCSAFVRPHRVQPLSCTCPVAISLLWEQGNCKAVSETVRIWYLRCVISAYWLFFYTHLSVLICVNSR